MKVNGYVRSFVAVSLIGLAAALADAQTVKVKVPFDFNVGNTSLQAGDYFVHKAIPHANPNVLQFRDSAGRTLALSMGTQVETINPVKEPKLVFHKYGNRYFLTQVWLDAGSAGTEIGKGKLELELAKSESASTVATIAGDAR